MVMLVPAASRLRHFVQVGIARTDHGRVDMQAEGQARSAASESAISTGTMRTATPRRVRAAWQAATVRRSADSGVDDHFAEDAAALVDGLEVDFLDELEAQLAAHDLAGDQDAPARDCGWLHTGR